MSPAYLPGPPSLPMFEPNLHWKYIPVCTVCDQFVCFFPRVWSICVLLPACMLVVWLYACLYYIRLPIMNQHFTCSLRWCLIYLPVFYCGCACHCCVRLNVCLSRNLCLYMWFLPWLRAWYIPLLFPRSCLVTSMPSFLPACSCLPACLPSCLPAFLPASSCLPFRSFPFNLSTCLSVKLATCLPLSFVWLLIFALPCACYRYFCYWIKRRVQRFIK